MSFDAKMTPLAKLTIEAQNRQNNKKNTRLTNLIFQLECFHFVLTAHNEAVDSILLQV